MPEATARTHDGSDDAAPGTPALLQCQQQQQQQQQQHGPLHKWERQLLWEALAAAGGPDARDAAPDGAGHGNAQAERQRWLHVPQQQQQQQQQLQQQQQQQQQQQHEQQQQHGLVAAAQGAGPAPGGNGEAQARWLRVVAVCAASALLMYATRSCISTSIVPMAEEFGWDKKTCGTVLSSFFAGYCITQILGGQLSDRYGGSAVLAGGVALWSACAALAPLAAAHGPYALLAARAGLGLAQGVAFPAIHALLARGVPAGRRSASIGAIMAMAHCGTALAFGLSPALIEVGGWPLTFYGFAALAALWAVPWLRMHRDISTAAHARPAQQQQQAQQQQAQQQQAQQQQAQRPRPGPDVGLWPLLRRREVWAICIAQYAAAFGFYGLMAWLPSFFLEHCGLQLSQLGGYTLAPYLLQAAVGASSGVMADHLIHNKGWRVRRVRVLFQVAGMLGPAAALTLATSPYGAHSAGAALAFISVGMGLSALASSGVSSSHLDIAPRHAGLVFGCGNTAGTLAGLVAVPATGWVLHHTGSWSLAFALAAAHNVAGAAIWAAWAGDRRLPEDGGPLEEEEGEGKQPQQLLLPPPQQQQEQQQQQQQQQ